MAAGHVAGAGASAAVTTVGGVFAGLIASRSAPKADLAENAWFVLSLAVAIIGVVALALVLLHWGWSSWRTWRRKKRNTAETATSVDSSVRPLPGIDVPGWIEMGSPGPGGSELRERRTLERELTAQPGVARAVATAHNPTATATPSTSAPTTETPHLEIIDAVQSPGTWRRDGDWTTTTFVHVKVANQQGGATAKSVYPWIRVLKDDNGRALILDQAGRWREYRTPEIDIAPNGRPIEVDTILKDDAEDTCYLWVGQPDAHGLEIRDRSFLVEVELRGANIIVPPKRTFRIRHQGPDTPLVVEDA
jgi:hypothetical protein